MFSFFLLNKIIKYKKKTLNKTAVDILKSKNKLIRNTFTPDYLGYEYETFSFMSDNLNLKGWYIKGEDESKTLVMLHGRNSNKMALVKYLRIFKDINFKCNIVLLDLRNSGESDTANTGFGYFFAKDTYNLIKYLNEKYGTKKYILYGFSQGGMAASLVPYLYGDKLKEDGIEIEKLILDSPISNVSDTIVQNSVIYKIRIPKLLVLSALLKFDFFIDNNLDNLRLSKTLGKVPTLFLQSEKDKVTTYDIFEKEYKLLNERSKIEEDFNKIKFKVFSNGLHVRMYFIYRWEYTNEIKEFLE